MSTPRPRRSAALTPDSFTDSWPRLRRLSRPARTCTVLALLAVAADRAPAPLPAMTRSR